MSGDPLCYGVRRLNPFEGVLQVVELGDARALSLDGVRWEIQVLCAQPEHTWRSANRGEPVMRFFRFGVWTPAGGLQRVPVSPILDIDRLLGASGALAGVLPACVERLPFAPADRHELWLLDSAGAPFALLSSTTQSPAGVGFRPEPWSASARSDHGFRSPRLLARGVPAREGHDPRHHATLLEKLIRDTAGRPARTGWFERDPEAGAVRDFPTLPLREDWPEAADRELVADYLDWCAPYLLTLPGLSDGQRDRFERAARSRAPEVDALFRLYPEVLHPDVLKAIRVEARMRRAAHA